MINFSLMTVVLLICTTHTKHFHFMQENGSATYLTKENNIKDCFNPSDYVKSGV